MPDQNDNIIRYNVHERGRHHRGQDRHFNLPALVAMVNSPAVQERVKNRDMLGYYGHWQRMRFGMLPPENVIVGGKVIHIEPATVTTYLRAEPDGTIEHRTEFLETQSGKVARRLEKSKAGGFSSAIDATSRNGLYVPSSFNGFDYVLEPNYTTNRAYVFDSAQPVEEGSIFDCVMADHYQSAERMAALYDSLQGDHMMAMQTIARLMEENEALMSAAVTGRALFDSVGAPAIAPRMVSKKPTEHFARMKAMFKSADLAPLDRLPDERTDMVLDHVRSHYGAPR